MKSSSGSAPVPQTFVPFGRYAGVGPQKIKSSHPSVRLHVGSASTLYLSKGTLLGKDITYISQVWNAWDAESTQTFYEQVLPYIHPETLRPLMGICTPTVIGVYCAAGGLSLAMELPHPVGWRSADPYISTELKEKVVAAYRSIHARNILHNDVKLENILIGDDNEVTIVDFCKMAVNPRPADLVLEMRAVKFMLDYNGAKEIEYGRLRKAESRAGSNLRRSWLRRAAESLGLAGEAECDESSSQDEADLPPFSHHCLMKWDSEVVTEGTTHCPGWKGERFEVPKDMRSGSWSGTEDTVSSPSPCQPIDPPSLVKTAFHPDPRSSSDQWMKDYHYSQSLWSPLLRSPGSYFRKSSVASSLPTTPIDLSDYTTGSERSYAPGADSSERDYSASPPSFRKRLRTEEFTRPADSLHGGKRVRRAKPLEPFAKYCGDQTSWATHGVEAPLPSPPSKQKRKEKELLSAVESPRETSPSEPDIPTSVRLSPSPLNLMVGSTRPTTGFSRRRKSALNNASRPSPSTRRTLPTSSPQCYCSHRKSERRCSVVVMDSDEEDKVWFMSREALQDVKGYLQVKKATGAAMEMRLEGEEGDIQHSRSRVERTLRPSSTRPTRKRSATPEDDDEDLQKQKRRRSWPETDLYIPKPREGSLLCNR